MSEWAFHNARRGGIPGGGLAQAAILSAAVIIHELAGDRVLVIAAGRPATFLSLVLALSGLATGYAFGLRRLKRRLALEDSPGLQFGPAGLGMVSTLLLCGMPVGYGWELTALRLGMLALGLVAQFGFMAAAGALMCSIYDARRGQGVRVLGADFAGAIGGVGVVAVLGGLVDYHAILAFSATIAGLAGATLARAARARAHGLAIAAAAAVLIVPLKWLHPVPVEDRRGFHTLVEAADTAREFCSWNSCVTLVARTDMSEGHLFLDGGNLTSSVYPPPHASPAKLSNGDAPLGDGTCTAMLATGGREIAVVGSSGGLELNCAARMPEPVRVDAINQIEPVFEAMTSAEGRALSGIYGLPGITAHAAEARRFLRERPGQYDLVVLREANDTPSGVASQQMGAGTTLVTIDGLKDLMKALKAGGKMIVSGANTAVWYRLFSQHFGPAWRAHVLTIDDECALTHIVGVQALPGAVREQVARAGAPLRHRVVCCGEEAMGTPFYWEVIVHGGLPGFSVASDDRPYPHMLRPWFARGFDERGAPAWMLTNFMLFGPAAPHGFFLLFTLGLLGFVGWQVRRLARTNGEAPHWAFAAACLGGLCFATFELTMIRLGLRLSTSPLWAWATALTSCLLGAGIAAATVSRFFRGGTFIGGALFLALGAGMLDQAYQHMPFEQTGLSDLLLGLAGVPVAYVLALPLAFVISRRGALEKAVPEFLIANAWGACAAPFVSLLCAVTLGHQGTLVVLALVCAGLGAMIGKGGRVKRMQGWLTAAT